MEIFPKKTGKSTDRYIKAYNKKENRFAEKYLCMYSLCMRKQNGITLLLNKHKTTRMNPHRDFLQKRSKFLLEQERKLMPN